jgi:hypothetical protein
MRPRFTLWSDYGTSARKYRSSAAMRGARSSVARKCLLAAAIVVAAAIASCELFGQAAEKMQDAAGHAQSATVKRSAGIAPIPLSPQPVRSVEEAAVTASIANSSIANSAPAHSATPALASDVPEGHAMPAITAVSGAMAKATALPPSPAALAATKAAEKPRGVGGRRNAQTVHHLRDDDARLIVRYVAARLGHNKELRAALRMFL